MGFIFVNKSQQCLTCVLWHVGPVLLVGCDGEKVKFLVHEDMKLVMVSLYIQPAHQQSVPGSKCRKAKPHAADYFRTG